MTASPQAALEDVARTVGWNLSGLVDTARFDRCQPREARCERLVPECGTALVFATGGAVSWRQGADACGKDSGPALQSLRRVLKDRTGLEYLCRITVTAPDGTVAEGAGQTELFAWAGYQPYFGS